MNTGVENLVSPGWTWKCCLVFSNNIDKKVLSIDKNILDVHVVKNGTGVIADLFDLTKVLRIFKQMNVINCFHWATATA